VRPAADLPLVVAAIFRFLTPAAERDEVLFDLGAEYRHRRTTEGAAAARWWVWRQALRSAPSLLRRSWWRGVTGFEPHRSLANRTHWPTIRHLCAGPAVPIMSSFETP